MKIKKSTRAIFIVISILTFLYLILAIRPLNSEYQFIPEWTKDIAETPLSTVGKDEQVSFFKLGQSAGYFTAEGEILSSITFPSRISISENYYATYGTDAADIVFYDKFGARKGQLNASGFPYFYDDRIYVFLPGGASFAKFNEKGNLLWTNENVMPITAFSSNEKFTAAGYVDGSISLIDNITGYTVTHFTPEGCEKPSILGIDTSNNGEYIACISGHDKQRFIVSQTVEDRQKIIFHKDLEDELFYRTLIKFFSDNNSVLYVYNNGVGIYDIKKKTNVEIPINDNIISIEESNNLVYLLGKQGRKYTVYIIEKTNTLAGQFSFEADSAFIKVFNNSLYVGKDTKLSRITVKKD